MKDGWHKFYEYEVYIEDGRVMRATDKDSTRTLFPYSDTRKYGVVNISGEYTLKEFRDAYRRGNAILR